LSLRCRRQPAKSSPSSSPFWIGRSRSKPAWITLDEGASRILVDALDPSDIAAIGAALTRFGRRPALLVGASGVAEAYAQSLGRSPRAAPPPAVPEPGPRLAIAGSRSAQTARQVAAARRNRVVHAGRADLSPEGLGSFAAAQARRLAAGANVLIALDPEADYAATPGELSARMAALAARILALRPTRALAVAGGDTSSAVVAALGARSLAFERRAGGGVAICRLDAPGSALDGAQTLLKGGQLGSLDLFDAFAGESAATR
jgi:uncharacterized protein YgbK (DUF1537 family)